MTQSKEPQGQAPTPRPATSTPNPSNFEKKGGRPWGGGEHHDKVARRDRRS